MRCEGGVKEVWRRCGGGGEEGVEKVEIVGDYF